MSDSISRLYQAALACRHDDPSTSRTARLLRSGRSKMAKKLAEEAVEVVIDATVEHIVARVAHGNVYVNRNMIGAVVGTQPFGGSGLSATGPKAGGPNYLRRFALEQVVSVNTAAVGGNASLLAEQS